MRYDTRYRYSGSQFSNYFPAGVKWLLISNVAAFVLYFFGVHTNFRQFFNLFALVPQAVVHQFAVWQLFTYMFLHDPFGFSHILFNMLTLWMFGVELERTWGTRRFLNFYFLCGIGAGVCVVLANLLFGSMYSRTIGASGAIFGLLMAYGLLFPERTVLFFFLFPIKVKYFVWILGAMNLMIAIVALNSGVSTVAHLGGMLFGYMYLKARFLNLDLASLNRRYQQWKLQRAKRKFQVYMKKHGSGGGPWVQ